MKNLNKLSMILNLKNNNFANFTFLPVSFLGFLDASYLTIKHFVGTPLPCSILRGCEEVTGSQYSMIGGIPVALLGAIYYLTIFVLVILYLNKKKSSLRNADGNIDDDDGLLRLIARLTIIGVLASLWFVFLQVFVIKAICLYCIFSAITSFLLFAFGIYVLKFKKISIVNMRKTKLKQTEILLLYLLGVIALIYVYETFIGKNYQKTIVENTETTQITEEDYSQKVIPEEGVVLPVKWGDLGSRMISAGVIDKVKFKEIYAGRGGLNVEEKKLLEGIDNGNLKITKENSGFILNLLWAFGLGNKNVVLEKGPMSNKEYGGAGNFASTGGWTLAQGDAMNHYSKHSFIVLTSEQQALVEKVSKGIFRPCCGNSTYFPDCNHGMAMLGLLELMASQGVSEDEMYKVALIVNSYWFPDTYITIAKYLDSQGKNWSKADPKEILGFDYSSGAGFQKIRSKMEDSGVGGGGSCGV